MAIIKEKVIIKKVGAIEEMIDSYKLTSNTDLMHKIVKAMESLVYKVISEFKDRGIDYNDLSQIGFTGLLVAINKFDASQGNKFSTYAVHCIRGEVLHFLRDKNLVKYPRWVFKTSKIISDYIKDFEEINGRFPTKKEVSDGINITVEEIDEILNVKDSIHNSESLDNNIEQNSLKLNMELIRTKNHKNFELMMEDRILLWNAINKLSELQKKIFISKFVVGKTQEEIGKDIGLSQKSISKYINESIRTLRNEIEG